MVLAAQKRRERREEKLRAYLAGERSRKRKPRPKKPKVIEEEAFEVKKVKYHRNCLFCDVKFVATGKFLRLCPNCRFSSRNKGLIW